jgi:hypothetical protein
LCGLAFGQLHRTEPHYTQRNWNDLSSKDYYVTINVVSARKSSKDNLLDCAVPIDRISTFARKSTQVCCGLIGEHDGLSQ